MPPGKVIHVVLDNYGTYKHPKVMAWLQRRPRWIFHFTPSSGSRLNAVENLFSALTRQRLSVASFIPSPTVTAIKPLHRRAQR